MLSVDSGNIIDRGLASMSIEGKGVSRRMDIAFPCSSAYTRAAVAALNHEGAHIDKPWYIGNIDLPRRGTSKRAWFAASTLYEQASDDTPGTSSGTEVETCR